MDRAKEVYAKLQKMKIKKEEARHVLSNAVESQLVASVNFREWRQIIGLRGKAQAQWEIRKLAIEILKILRKHAPTIFEDFEIDEEKERNFEISQIIRGTYDFIGIPLINLEKKRKI